MLNKRFLDKVSAFISANKLLQRGAKHIVALSGGADSVMLLLCLKQLGYDVEAAHCNFHLRGNESDRDEKFCRALCEEHAVKLHVIHFDTVEFASLHKISIEMAARRLRYSYFEQLRKDIGASSVCVAHHKDDTVETVLMNLIRGTGIHGLTGISMKNGMVVRPLLCVFRNEIEAALGEIGQPYVTDSTNLEADVVRNKIRLNLLPMMRDINPSVSDSIATTARRMVDAAKMFDQAMSDAIKRVSTVESGCERTISIDLLMAEAAPEYVLFSILKDYCFTPQQVENIFKTLSSDSGKTFTTQTYELLIDRGQILLEPLAETSFSPMRILETGLYNYCERIKLRVQTFDAASIAIERSPNVACLDASKALFPLTIRPVVAGDKFYPFGMNGSKLVSDYLTDRKRNLFEKRRQLVITDSMGRIVWLVNERPDNRYRITEHTQTVLRLSLEG